MGLLHPLVLSDWAKNLTMRVFYRACQNPGRKNSHFQLLTHHYIARHTLLLVLLLELEANWLD